MRPANATARTSHRHRLGHGGARTSTRPTAVTAPAKAWPGGDAAGEVSTRLPGGGPAPTTARGPGPGVGVPGRERRGRGLDQAAGRAVPAVGRLDRPDQQLA